MQTKMRDVIIIDGQNFLFRAHYSHQRLQTSDGIRTSCIYGLPSMLFEVLMKYPATDIVFVWDHFLPSGHTGPSPGSVSNFKQEIGKGIYKAKRQKNEETQCALEQGRQLVPVLEGLGFLQLGVPGLEADDLIGICASALASATPSVCRKVYVMTGDRDMLQLCSDRIHVLQPKKPSGYRVMTPTEVKAEHGVSVGKFAKYLGLGGDTSDDYKAIPNVGPKKAAALVNDGLDPACKTFLELPEEVRTRYKELAPTWDHIHKCYKLAYIPRTTHYKLMPPVVQQMAEICVKQILNERRRQMTRFELRRAESNFKRFCEVHEMTYLRERAFTFLRDVEEL